MFGFFRKEKNDAVRESEPTVPRAELLKTVDSAISTVVDRTLSALNADIKTSFALKADISVKEDKIKTLKAELSELTLQKTMDEREIKQFVHIKEENAKLEAEKKIVALESDYVVKEAKLREEFSKKEIENIIALGKDMKEIHKEILNRLPNINARLRVEDKG